MHPSKEGNPSLDNLEAILNAMNLKLKVEKRAA
jgi:DNA-binding phage protein